VIRHAALLLVLALVACDDMADQAKNKPYHPAPGGVASSAQPHPLPPAGTVARDETDTAPPPLDLALLQRGEERFNIYCSPCHGRVGDGHGMIVQRGFPAPPSYHIDRLRQAPTQHFYDVITDGYGAMYSYAARVPPRDRWAIAAYIRVLQESQHAAIDAVPTDRRKALR
jgi:mono/diheme cytochrome c family protein